MGLFSAILQKVGLGGSDAGYISQEQFQQKIAAIKAASSPAVTTVDVVSQLEKMAASSGQKLDWKVSIVDLMKLLGLDNSFTARKEMAIELGCPADKMGDSAQMNMWLHKTVLQKLAANGGNIPKELL